MPRTRTVLATVGAAALLVCGAAPALADGPEPPRHLSQFIAGGADGKPREVFCPSMQHAYSGGFTLSARSDSRLAPEAADVIESRLNDHASGWIVTVRKAQVRKLLVPGKSHQSVPADLTVHIGCTDDTMMHGA
ncbi:hypothetical protein [Streptomyces sp. NPDC005209]|uniref:hypothetical protein n=1 Tax=Streptomyces sp. NPDC005209 TaxID=3156715 RepID=UPI0033B5D788